MTQTVVYFGMRKKGYAQYMKRDLLIARHIHLTFIWGMENTIGQYIRVMWRATGRGLKNIYNSQKMINNIMRLWKKIDVFAGHTKMILPKESQKTPYTILKEVRYKKNSDFKMLFE